MTSPSRPEPPPDCPLERYLHVVSGAWVPRILWFLRFGPRRFGDLRRDLRGISTKVLTAKLRTLEADRLVSRQELATSPRQVQYALTERGMAFEPVFEAMIRVSHHLAELEEATDPAMDR
ncbi:MAG: helix-turn-helix transcriptional regulator [Zoogloeaceae bacterium]|nr:helix-turn-helix transcriptional regulator [Zoogloeaceae bacterium]